MSVQVYDGDGNPTTILGKLYEYIDKLIASKSIIYDVLDQPWMRKCAKEYEKEIRAKFNATRYDLLVQEHFALKLNKIWKQRECEALEGQCDHCTGTGQAGLFDLEECPECDGRGWNTAEQIADRMDLMP